MCARILRSFFMRMEPFCLQDPFPFFRIDDNEQNYKPGSIAVILKTTGNPISRNIQLLIGSIKLLSDNRLYRGFG